MEAMEFLSSPEADPGQGPGVFQTVRVETEALPPIVELGRKLLAKAQAGDAEAVKDLMKQGAPFTPDWLGTSPLHFACQYNHYDVVELLLKSGISKDARNKVDRTPLHVTSQEGHIKILKLLLTYGVDVDATDMLRMTSLHWAAENGHEECVKLLLEHGADPVAVNKFDKTPDQISFDNDRLDICHIIQEYAENPLRHLHRKEAKERQKKAAAAHKAALELEKNTRSPSNKLIGVLGVNGDKVLRPMGQEIRILKEEVRILKLPRKKVPSKVIFENELRLTNGVQTNLRKQPTNSVPMLTQASLTNQIPLTSQENREKTLQLLQAHGITMLPADESTVVGSAVQSGQKVMLTEAGKMALNLTEKPFTLKPTTTPVPVKGMIKLPHHLLKGKRLIRLIRPDQLINMKNQQKVIIQTDKMFRPAVTDIAQKQNLVVGKQKMDVLLTKQSLSSHTQLMSSAVEKPPPTADLNSSTLSLDRLLDETLNSHLEDDSSQAHPPAEEETEMQRVHREMEEMKKQIKMLQEQYMKKEEEAQYHKTKAEEYKHLVDVLQNELNNEK